MAQAEIKAIVKKRNHFEYALKRIGSEKEDYLRYIQYEMNLNILQKKRKKKLGTARPSPSAALLFFLLHVVPQFSIISSVSTREIYLSHF
jgi:U3 small nucleolar RNA-associated protein 6